MRKLKLEIERLAVELFQTVAPRGAERGTVRGHGVEPTLEEQCEVETTHPTPTPTPATDCFFCPVNPTT